MFFGTTPVYTIADMDLFKEITVKHFDKFVDRLVSGLIHSCLQISVVVVVKCINTTVVYALDIEQQIANQFTTCFLNSEWTVS